MSIVKRNITTLTNFKRGANDINKIIRETTLIWQRITPSSDYIIDTWSVQTGHTFLTQDDGKIITDYTLKVHT
jgi:hypothetical protein